MAVSRGKQFEKAVRESLELIQDVSIDRLADPCGGFSGVKNICDFIVFKSPVEYYFECKAEHGLSINFKSDISETQWNGLLKKSTIRYVLPGICLWFVDYDITAFVPIWLLEYCKSIGFKSLSVNQLKEFISRSLAFEISGQKKRVIYKYDFHSLLIKYERVMYSKLYFKDKVDGMIEEGILNKKEEKLYE